MCWPQSLAGCAPATRSYWDCWSYLSSYARRFWERWKIPSLDIRSRCIRFLLCWRRESPPEGKKSRLTEGRGSHAKAGPHVLRKQFDGAGVSQRITLRHIPHGVNQEPTPVPLPGGAKGNPGFFPQTL